MKYDTLKALVNAKVYENTEQEITGEGLNEVLQSAIASLGAHYQMGGLVSPNDKITVGDEPVVFLATTPGTYTYFGGIVVADGEVALLVWSGTAWSKQTPDIATRTEVSQLGQKVYLDVFGEAEIEKAYIWSNGYVAAQSILNSTLSKFCQPVLFKSGEKLSYKTNSTYGSAVIQVADDTPLSVDSTNFNLQTLINASVANQEYEYTFEQDMWVVISVLKSDYSLKVEKVSDNSIDDRVEHLEDISSPEFTSNSSLNAIFDELYINGFFEGLYISYFVWNGTKVTAILRDSQDNIVWFANGLDATTGSVFSFSQNGITLYALLNSTTHLTSPIVATLQLRSLNIRYSPQIFDYIVNSKTDMEYPINVSRFDQGGTLPAGHKASWITINRRMDEDYDSVLNFCNKTYPNLTNKWFDFYSVSKHARGTDGVSKCSTYIDSTDINGLSTSDALMMAVIVGAVNNIDGDNTIKWHTGGAHAYGDSAIGASPTMRELSNTVLADGKNVPVGRLNVKCKKLTMDVVNNVQGYNTCKEDGTGREIIQQRYHVEVTNDYCEVVTELVALEEVIVYGPNVVTGISMSNMQYRFIGSDSKRGLYTYNGSANVPSNGDCKIDTLRVEKDGYIFEVEYDLDYGLGNKLMSETYNLFVTNAAKAYFANIPTESNIHLNEGDSINWRVRLNIRKA